jgi:hypothetical protein
MTIPLWPERSGRIQNNWIVITAWLVGINRSISRFAVTISLCPTSKDRAISSRDSFSLTRYCTICPKFVPARLSHFLLLDFALRHPDFKNTVLEGNRDNYFNHNVRARDSRPARKFERFWYQNRDCSPRPTESPSPVPSW